ncbi:uncharacterized protein RSE6_12057 [Rhynchosporium secalis]|uniref:Uncharacterized protein n=1 Tax=Rhynchosporium secalis TaxID=38038 RepID=A0A1E1MPI1_RHYSE|nr:uncharacterized protein RSE6_12057 [Rhynchosporium secalis]
MSELATVSRINRTLPSLYCLESQQELTSNPLIGTSLIMGRNLLGLPNRQPSDRQVTHLSKLKPLLDGTRSITLRQRGASE